MSRWRPPPASSTPIITRSGYLALQAEMDGLWRMRRPRVVQALAAAAAEGDRSENAEYQYRKKELAEIDRRVRYLSKRIPQLRQAPEAPDNVGRVYFGAHVDVKNLTEGKRQHWHIVGPDETNARLERISIDSPLARALLGRAVGDEVEVRVPAGIRHLQVAAISYSGTV